MEPRAPAVDLALMGAQRKPSGTTPAKRAVDGGRVEAPAAAAAAEVGGAAAAGASAGLAPRGGSRPGSTAGAIGLFHNLLSPGEPEAKRARTAAPPRGRQRAAVVVHQRGGANAFKSPRVTSQPRSQPASAAEADAAAAAPQPAPPPDTAAAPRTTHADGALPQPMHSPRVAPLDGAFEPAEAPAPPEPPRLSALFSPGFDAAALIAMDNVDAAAAAAAASPPPPPPLAEPAPADAPRAATTGPPPSVDDAYQNNVARSLRSGGAGGTPSFAATRGGTAGGGTAHTSQPSRPALPPASPDPVAALTFSPAAAQHCSEQAPMEYAQPESFHRGGGSGHRDAFPAHPAARFDAPGEPRDGGDAGDGMDSGPSEDSDEAAEVDADVDDEELERAKMVMTQKHPHSTGGLDISAIIAGATQRERSGRGGGSQLLSPRADGGGALGGGLPSVGEPHQLSYYGLNEAICNVYAAKGMTRLYEWQVEALAQPGVLGGGSLVYSAPTSAGKSLVADVLLLRSLLRSPRRGVLVVLPYNALCDEKAAGLERLAQPLGVQVHRHYSDRNGPLPTGDLGIIVCTFEKANAIVARLIEADRLCAVGCVVVDELHMLSDEGRGPTLESLCSTLLYYSFIEPGTSDAELHSSPALRSQQQRLRSAQLPESQCRIQMIGMSATLPNFSVLGTWWRAATYVTGYRPTPLEHRFVHGEAVLDSDGALVRTLEARPVVRDVNDCVMVHLVQETIDAGGSVLVFCASKADTVNAAKLLAEHLAMPEPPSKSAAPDDLTREEATERLGAARPADKQLPHLAACVAKGVAFHNSSLNLDEREVVQDCFRFGKVRVICCTSTLAAGVNLPARRVILRQDYAYGSLPGSSAVAQLPLQPAQYQQMAGRAGRTGLDKKGESFIIAKPRADAAHVAELRKLVLPDARPLTSALASPLPAEGSASSEYFKLFVLYAVSSGLVVTDLDMQRYVECTLLATLQTAEERAQDALRKRFNAVAQELFRLGVLAKERPKDAQPGMPNPPGKWVVTAKGKSVVASSLPVREAQQLQAGIDEACKLGLVLSLDSGHLHALFVAAPAGMYFPTRWSGYHWPALKRLMVSARGEEARLLTHLGFDGDADRYSPDSKHESQLERGARLQRLHVAMVLRELAQERSVEEICSRYGFAAETDVTRLQEAGSRNLYCAAAMCEARGQSELQSLFARLQQRVVAGTQQELVELADVAGVNRLRARALYNAGIQTLDALVAQPWVKVAEALAKVNPNTAKPRFADKRLADKILRNARAAVAERDRRNRQETLDKLAAAGLGGEALQRVADELNARSEAASAKAQSAAASLQSPGAATAALAAAAERALQQRAALVAAAAVVDAQPPPPPPPPPLPLGGHRGPAFEAAVAAAAAQLATLSGACVLGDADAAAFEALLRALCAAPLYGFAFASRHDKDSPHHGIAVYGLAVALRPGGVVFVSFDGAGGDARRVALAAVLAQPGPFKAALHAKEQVKALACRAQPRDVPAACLSAIGPGVEDPLIFAYLLAPDGEPNTFKLFELTGVAQADVMKASRFRGAASALPACVQDAAFAAATALAVRAKLRAMLEGPALHVPLAQVEMPLVPVLAAMELLGVPFRREDLADPVQKAHLRLLELERLVRNAVGLPSLRLTSPDDVSYGLFVHRARGRPEPLCAAPPGAYKRNVKRNGAPMPKYSTDKATLEQVLRAHAQAPHIVAVVSAVLEHRSLQDLVSTCESLQSRQDPGDGRLRGTFLQTKAETGRLAMDEPSLHNIPHARQFTLGATARKHTLALRSAFAPAAGRVLLLADYRQFELRMMLHFAGDAELTARLVGPDAPCDPFKGLAALWCRKDVAAVTEDERAWAKTVSYGLLYGKAVSTMAFDLGIDVAQAQLMVDAFKESLPAVGTWLKKCVDDSRMQDEPCVTTVAGRRRMLPMLNADGGDKWRSRAAAERQAVNTVCQGSAADVMKRAMTQLQRHLAADPARRATLLLSVHDDVMLEVEEAALPELAALTRAVMVQAGIDVGLRAPLAVRLRWGPNWHSLTDMD